MPESAAEKASDIADQIRVVLGKQRLAKYGNDLELLRDVLKGQVNAAATSSDEELRALVVAALAPPPTREEEARLAAWDPVDLLVPEWRYLQKDPIDDHHEDAESGLTLSRRAWAGGPRPEITRVLAAERLRKVNALVGFTRIDAPGATSSAVFPRLPTGQIPTPD